jgi:hypothetical protein
MIEAQMTWAFLPGSSMAWQNTWSRMNKTYPGCATGMLAQ